RGGLQPGAVLRLSRARVRPAPASHARVPAALPGSQRVRAGELSRPRVERRALREVPPRRKLFRAAGRPDGLLSALRLPLEPAEIRLEERVVRLELERLL